MFREVCDLRMSMIDPDVLNVALHVFKGQDGVDHVGVANTKGPNISKILVTILVTRSNLRGHEIRCSDHGVHGIKGKALLLSSTKVT